MTEPRTVAGAEETSSEDLGLLVGLLRLLRGWTQQELAFSAGIHQATVSKYELGLPPPGWSELARLSGAIGLPMWAIEGVLLPAIRVSRALAVRSAEDVPANVGSLFADSVGTSLSAAARIGIAELLIAGMRGPRTRASLHHGGAPVPVRYGRRYKSAKESIASLPDVSVMVGFLRLMANRTQREMATKASIHAATLSRYEQGKRLPGARALARLAEEAHLPMWFLEGVLAPVVAFARPLLQ